MRKTFFRFFAAIFVITLIVTIVFFDEMSYVGVKIQYFLFTVLIITFPLSWISYKKNSGYLSFED